MTNKLKLEKLIEEKLSLGEGTINIVESVNYDSLDMNEWYGIDKELTGHVAETDTSVITLLTDNGTPVLLIEQDPETGEELNKIEL